MVRSLQVLGIGIALSAFIAASPPESVAASQPDPTWAEDVAPIVYKNCTVCHHIDGVGPFPLFEYDSAVAYKKEMKEKVSAGEMPPWHAVGPRGVFRNDRRLLDAERNTILRWLETGTRKGDLSKLPPRPSYPSEWAIGTPDVILSMPTEYTVPARGKIDYQYFVVPTNFTEDKWIQAYEILPGMREVVHHVQVYALAPKGSDNIRNVMLRSSKFQPPAPRAPTEPQMERGTLISSMAPGTNAIDFPKGTAMLVKAGTVLTFLMHYTAHGHVMKDRTSIGFKFAKQPPDERIYASQFTNSNFVIPAGTKDVAINANVVIREPIKLWGMLPHTHVRGTRWLYKLQERGGSTNILLDIPNYDFNWQTYYLWKKPLEIPAGARILSTAWYDNSPANEENPDPTVDVHTGQQTWDEMQYTGLLYSIPSERRSRVAVKP